MREHDKAVDALRELNDYCCNGNCEQCVFHVLKDCPFYIIGSDAFDILMEEIKRLESDKNEKSTD